MDSMLYFKIFQTKAKLYGKFLKNRNFVNKENYRTFTHLFESIKRKSKKIYYHNLSITYGYMKRTSATINPLNTCVALI